MTRIKAISLFLWISITVLAQTLDTVSVKFQGNGYEKRSFDNQASFFTNKKYKVQNVPTAFRNFEFLANQGGIAEDGFITIATKGLIYIIAPTAISIDGWSPVENSEFTYDDAKNSTLCIYQKRVNAGQKIQLPVVSRFAGVTPIARKIQYGSEALEVDGKLIDILTVKAAGLVFPQNSTFKFGKVLPAAIINKKYAVSLIENQGVNRIKCKSEIEITIGLHYKMPENSVWKFTGDSLSISSARNYYIYTTQYSTANQWLELPKPLANGLVAPTIVFGENLKVDNPLRVPGTVITKSQDIKNLYITNPSVVILPNGDYLASCSGALRNKGDKGGVSFFISTDKGKTWQVQSNNSVVMTFCNLFVHKGELYLMGTNKGYKDAVISKSTDNGKTWTTPENASNGLLLTGGYYHSAPVPAVVQNGRIWRAMENCETEAGKNKRALVMSAPVDADLMNASSWTVTNELSFDIPAKLKENHDFKQWLEGNVVVDKSGSIVNMLRVDELKEGGFAALTHVSGVDKLSFDPEKDIIRFPGGGKKFTIRFDPVSNKYWTISNAEFEEDRVKTHSGKYKTGVHASLLRNRVVLMYSDDLRTWNVKDTLISADNPFFYGFQYTDWQFDGNDIIAVTRTAFEEERGLPMRQHDANFFTFYRFKDFRNSKIQALKPE